MIIEAVSILAVIVALASAFFAARSARFARDTVISSVILNVAEAFDDEILK